jgi:peptide/nickel transport system substrate-binding protein
LVIHLEGDLLMRFQLRGPVSAALATVLVVSIAAAPQRAVTHAASDSQTLLVANYEWDGNLDPAVQYGQVAPVIFRNCYDSLIRLKGSSTSQYVGDLATSWSANAAKTAWTFNLRKGVKFHDGTSFDATAVQFSINRLLTINQGPAFILGQFMNQKSVKVIGPYQVEFDLTSPAPRLLAAMTSQWANWIVSPATVKAHTVKKDLGQLWLSDHDAGSGPYIMTKVVPNSSVEMVKNPNYWGGWSGKHVSRIVMSYVPEEQTRRSLIEKGGIDLTLFFSPQNLVALQQNPQLKVDVSPGVLQELLIPTVSGPFASPLARQALAYAFDYDAMNKVFLKGFAVQSQGPIAHSIYGHDNNLPIYHTDLAKARQLFAQAGMKPGTTVTLWYISNDQLAKEIALITQGQLGQLGITVKTVGKDSNTINNAEGGTEPASQRPNLWATNWFPDYSDPIDVITPLYHSKGNLGGAVNMGLYSNKQVDSLLAQAAVTTDPAKQQGMFNQIQTTLTVDDPAAVYISDTSYQQVYRSSLHGFYSNPTYGNTFDFYPMYK